MKSTAAKAEQQGGAKRPSSVVTLDESDSDSNVSDAPSDPSINQDHRVVQSWVNTFHALDNVDSSFAEELVPLPGSVASSQLARAALDSSVDLSGMDDLLDSVHFDELVHDIFDDNNRNFTDMLDEFAS